MKISLEQVKDFKPDFGYFTLKNDKDSAKIRILWETMADIDIRTLHKVKAKNGFEYRVDCLRATYDDPKDMCPCCVSSNWEDRKIQTTCYIPIYNLDKERVEFWTRTGDFVTQALLPKLTEAGEPYCATVFTVERNGEAGDQNTRYELINEYSDDFTLDDLEDIPTAAGACFLEKSYEELEQFMKTRTFEDSNNSGEDTGRTRNRLGGSDNGEDGVRRRGSDNDEGGVKRRGVRPTV